MNGEIYESEASLKAKLDSQIITQTLDNLNGSQCGGKSKKGSSTQQAMSNTYEFSKEVLSAAYSDKGAIFGAKG